MILFMVCIEIGVPLFCYYYYDWNYTETIFTLWTELIISLVYFYCKNAVHIYHQLYRLPQFKKSISVLQKLYRLGFVMIINFCIGAVMLLAIIYMFYISMTAKTEFTNVFQTIMEIIKNNVRKDALWFVELNIAASILNKILPFIVYWKKNKWSNSKFYWIIPPEYIGNRNLFFSVIAMVILAIALLLYSKTILVPILLIYVFCLIHLFMALVKIVFPVDKTTA